MLARLFPFRSRRRALAKKVYTNLAQERPFECPPNLRVKQRPVSEAGKDRLIQSLKENYFSDPCYYPDPVEKYLSTHVGQEDLKDQVDARLQSGRKWIIPWLDEVSSLAGARVLEIGCGTGSSTVALAEQGAEVVGLDVSQESLRVAEDRCQAYGLNARFIHSNATEAYQLLGSERFDYIIFFASLEHMTLDERLDSIKSSWQMLLPGSHLVIIETPNRLWYFDVHTSQAPFFLWLPDDLAFLYSRLTPRELFNEIFRDPTDEAKIQFSRWGRGVSFHEFELALGCPAEELPVVSCKTLFFRERANSRGLGFLNRLSLGRRYEAMLFKIQPKIHRGFYLPYLDLAFRKP